MDDLGFSTVNDPVYVHDPQATASSDHLISFVMS